MTSFKPGQKVGRSGIYRVEHASHRLMHEATLLAEDLFPSCRRCGDQVRFELIRALRDQAVLPFREGEILVTYSKIKSIAG
ncbi:MAG TPA: hypothetical protein VFK81_10425 [Terriglobales bacterium]|nr:hypothetical protein [Terriglobales bacterium]